MSSGLSDDDLRALATCLECSGTRVVPDILGEYVLCAACAVLPRESGWTCQGGRPEAGL